VVYFYAPGRAGENAETFLTGLDGVLQTPLAATVPFAYRVRFRQDRTAISLSRGQPFR
jgi:hypothetical protein